MSALPRPELPAVGLTPAVGVPPAGEVTGVGEVFAVGVIVGEGFAVGVMVGGAGVGERVGVFAGVAVTGGRLTGEPCGPVGVGLPVVVPPGVAPVEGDELAIVLVLLELETRRMVMAVRGLLEASRAAIKCSPGAHVGLVASHTVTWNAPRAFIRTQACWWFWSSNDTLPSNKNVTLSDGLKPWPFS